MRLRGELFEAMLKQEVAWFDDKANNSGALCARLSGEASSVQGVNSIYQFLCFSDEPPLIVT